MNKSDLKDGMVVEYRNGKRGILLTGCIRHIHGFKDVIIYEDDLTYKNNKDLDIMRVFKVLKGSSGVHGILVDGVDLDLIWEREEVDWSKVKVGTEVLVKDFEEESWVTRVFVKYREDIKAYSCLSKNLNGIISWEQCKLKEDNNVEDRKTTLLKACLELLQKQETSPYVLDMLNETVHYDECDCDGYCLMNDIRIELGLDV